MGGVNQGSLFLSRYLFPILICSGSLFLVAGLLIFPEIVTRPSDTMNYLSQELFKHNFYEVVPGKLFRSGEFSPEELQDTIREQGIRSILDLRLDGGDKDKHGILEAEVVAQVGAVYYHLPLKSGRVPSRKTIKQLLAIYEQAPLPLLIHCSSGSHRTGVATALWLIDQAGEDPTTASQALSPRYGNFPNERKLSAFLDGRPTIDSLIWSFADDHKRTGETFREWLPTHH